MSGKYKDSLFRSLFNDKAALLELYGSIENKSYASDTEIVINTLSDTIFTHQKNDISFMLDGKLVVLIEHQSTINENMPFRLLSPAARLLENSLEDKKTVYRRKRIQLPRVEFIVLYNGTDNFPDKATMKLSDAFEKIDGFDEINLELIVKVYNINKGYNTDIIEKSTVLSGYVTFVSMVKDYQKNKTNGNLTEAIAKSIVYCKEHNVLKDFFANLSMEESNMLADEWDMDVALAVRREEGVEEGIEKGIEAISNLLEQGYSLQEAKAMLLNKMVPA